MDPNVVKKLGKITKWVDGHLIFMQKGTQFKCNGQRYAATHVRFSQKHNKEVAENTMLRKTCDVKGCVEHCIDMPIVKRNRPNPENEDDDTEDIRIKDFPVDFRQVLLKRIDEKCVPGKPKSRVDGECRLWQGSEYNGAGQIRILGKTQIVSRAAYQLHYVADIPNGHQVRHLCGNSLCTAKEHLATGTQVENERDKVATGTNPVGENNPNCKFSDEVVKEIFESQLSAKECASKFGCTQDYVYSIRHGDIRNEVTGLDRPKKKSKLVKKALTPEDEKEAKAYIFRNCTEWTDLKTGETHWFWDLYTRPSGHGVANFHNVQYPAHALAYRAWHKCAPLDPDDEMRHKCKYPCCVNPDHVEPGKHVENMADKVRDGTDSRGEKSWNALLTELCVRHIKAIRGVFTKKERADMFEVSVSAICSIDQHLSWDHIKTDDEYDDYDDSYDGWNLDDAIQPAPAVAPSEHASSHVEKEVTKHEMDWTKTD